MGGVGEHKHYEVYFGCSFLKSSVKFTCGEDAVHLTSTPPPPTPPHWSGWTVGKLEVGILPLTGEKQTNSGDTKVKKWSYKYCIFSRVFSGLSRLSATPFVLSHPLCLALPFFLCVFDSLCWSNSLGDCLSLAAACLCPSCLFRCVQHVLITKTSSGLH